MMELCEENKFYINLLISASKFRKTGELKFCAKDIQFR